jgi:antitoxin MazE
VRLPKPLIEEAGLQEEVELRVQEGVVVIAPSAKAREGWAQAARRLRERGEDRLDPVTDTHFDSEAWQWK